MSRSAWSLATRVDPLSGERMDTWTHAGGMTLLHVRRPGFTRAFAGFAVPYGSVHTAFDAGRRVDVPAGTAHYLEHCVFTRDEQGGLLSAMSALGAHANAYTTHTHTLYHFTATDAFEASFRLMLAAVLRPELGEARVEAERPIILSELAMYRDEPDSRAFTALLEGLYAAHPVRTDIGGTAETVARISSDHLRAVHEAFYAPGRMVLAVVGDVDAKPLLPLLSEAIEGLPAAPPASPAMPEEPAAAPAPRSEIRMDVGMPSFLVGIKDPAAGDGEWSAHDRAVRRRAGRLVFETLLGPASPVYDGLYAEGLVTESFGFHYLCEDGFAFLAAGGESPEPERAAREVLRRLRESYANGLDPEAFERQRRVAAGQFLRSLDSTEGCGLSALHAALAGVDLFDYPGIYDSMDRVEAAERMRFLLDDRLSSVSLVMPAEVDGP